MIKNRYIFFCLLLVSGCRSGNPPGSAPDRDQLVKIYADMLIIREENNISRLDSTPARHRIDSLYKTYKTSSGQVDSSIQYYKNDINQWREFYDDVAKRIEEIQQQQRQKATN